MSKYSRKTTQGIYQRITSSMSGLNKTKIVVNDCNEASFDYKNNIIMLPSVIAWADNDEDDFLAGRGLCVHESSHLLFGTCVVPDCKKYEEKGICPKDFKTIINVFNDVNNEYKASIVFPNVAKALIACSELLDKGKDVVKPENPFLQILYRTDMLYQKPIVFPDNYHPDLKQFVLDTVKGFKDRKLHSAKGKEIVKYAHETFNNWRNICEKKNQGSNPNCKLKISSLMKQLGQMIKDKASEQDIKDIEKQISDLSKPKKWFDEPIDRRKVRDLSVPPQNYSDKELDDVKEEVKKITVNKEEENGSLSQGWSNGGDNFKCTRPEGCYSELTYDIHKAYDNGKKIHSRLKKKIELQEDYEKNHRSGRLNISEVRKQISTCGKIYKNNFFERNFDYTRGGEWAIEVNVDCSGSMGWDKMSLAKTALATLGYALDGLPNVKWALTGFTSGHFFEAKKFTDRRLIPNFLNQLQATGGTPIDKAIAVSCKKLLKFSCPKICVVITDGEADTTSVRENVDKARSLGINVIGIGIEGSRESSLRAMFKDYYFFKESNDLVSELTSLIVKCLDHKKLKNKLVKRYWEA